MNRPTLTRALLVVSLGTQLLVPQADAADRTQSPAVPAPAPVASVNFASRRTLGAARPESPSSAEAGAAAIRERCTECDGAQTSLGDAQHLANWLAAARRTPKTEDATSFNDLHEEIARNLVRYAKATAPTSKAAQSGTAEAQSGTAEAQSGTAEAESGDQGGSRDGDGKTAKSSGGAGNGFDASLVQAGETAFNNNCTSCHDAQKSLQTSKSLAGWRTTVRRMAGKPDAQIPESALESIATYLASRNERANEGTQSGDSGADGESQFSFTGTISPTWRGGATNLQDPGFFPGLWVGAAWQSKGPVSARATACITCHTNSRADLVEATVRFDITKHLRSHFEGDSQTDVAVEAGRFVVPFGAFYQQVNPGVYRTVTQPLIYNMGQRVFASNLNPGLLGYPVLPMPYSDTGGNLSVAIPIAENATATFDGYLVNGLQGTSNGVDFVLTRQNLFSNNSSPAGGGRFSIGGKNLRLGASVMGGRFNSNAGSGPFNQGMNYLIFGADAVFRWEDRLRLQFEYAQRNSDRLGTVPNSIFTERVGGFYLECEALISRRWNLSFLTRYDGQSTQSLLPPAGSSLTTNSFTVQRFTYGLNWTLPGGSLLMLNEEHWSLPAGLGSIDVLGVRWAATF